DFKKKKAEMKRTRKGWKVTREGSLRLPGQFQGRVFDMGGGVGTGVGITTGVGVGSIRCGDGVTELRPSPARPYAHYTVKLLTPAGALLDNPADVRLVVYGCDLLASSCPSCAAVNSTFSCGWCLATRSCTTHAHCLGTSWIGPGRSCDSEENLKSLGEPLSEPRLGLGEVLQPLDEDEEHKLHKNDLTGFDNLESFLEGHDQSDDVDVLGDEEEEGGDEEDMGDATERRLGEEGKRNKKKKGNKIKKAEGGPGRAEDVVLVTTPADHVDTMINDSSARKPGRVGGKKRSGKRPVKGKLKVTSRGRSFLRLPQHPGLFVARDAWRLHTGRQYYIPVTKKTLINLGFVRQVTYGSLAEEKTRTVLINGAWKKAAGYFVDLFEKVDHDPVTSVITTSRSVFEQLLTQLLPEQ
ncbi:hypothetical protein OTU49_016787, partial [Cherax quadricarinatus]